MLGTNTPAYFASSNRGEEKSLMRWHQPDLHQNSEESSAKFIEIGEAYEVLSDPTKRKVYDETIGMGQPNFNKGSTKIDPQWAAGVNDFLKYRH